MTSTRTIGSRVGYLLGAAFLLAGCYDSDDVLGGDSHFLHCDGQAECAQVGPKYACIAGECRPMQNGSSDGSANQSASADQSAGNHASTIGAFEPNEELPDETPLVMLLVDSSGSMERRSGCTCLTPGCEECLPDCEAGEKNRWTEVLSTLTGTFDGFSCETLARTAENGATYDFDYYLPYNKPSGEQRADGLLDVYGDRLRFGLATFDGSDSYVGNPTLTPMDEYDFDSSEGRDGMWSYNPERAIAGLQTGRALPIGSFRYPSSTAEYLMDTGIRNPLAESGALLFASGAHAGVVNTEIQDSLLAVRPYGGTPIAAALDDLYFFMDRDPSFAAERASSAPRHVVLISDGFPDTDWRQFGCDCALRADPEAACSPSDPSEMHCPYPTPVEAARALRCGQDAAQCSGPVAELHVISFAADSATVRASLDAIAVEGGGQGAHLAASALALRQELDSVLAEIAGD